LKKPGQVQTPTKPATRATYAKVAVIVASATFVTARLVDLALIGSGIAAAAGSAIFAGVMVMQNDHAPRVNGMKYLSVFAAPKGGVRQPAAATDVAQDGQEQPGVDLSPVGAIPPAATTKSEDYSLVSARTDHAWVQAGSRIFAVHPGDVLPNLGKVASIEWGSGHWTLVGEKGEPLLISGDGLDLKNPQGAYAKPMILQDGD
jgi:hypothetical protein